MLKNYGVSLHQWKEEYEFLLDIILDRLKDDRETGFDYALSVERDILLHLSFQCAYLDDDKTKLCIITRLKGEKSYVKDQRLRSLQTISENILFRYTIHDERIRFSGDLLHTLFSKSEMDLSLEELIQNGNPLNVPSQYIDKIRNNICQEIVAPVTVKLKNDQGESRWVKIFYELIYRKDGVLSEVMGKISDITQSMLATKYYDDAIALWHTDKLDQEAAVCLNIHKNKVVGGFSTLFCQDDLHQISADDYFSRLYENVLSSHDDRNIEAILNRKSLLRRYKTGDRHENLDVQIKTPAGVQWLKILVTLVENPNTGHVMALLIFHDINETKLMMSVYEKIALSNFDFIACIFAKTDSYQIMKNNEKNNLRPLSAAEGYHALICRLSHCFSEEKERKYLRQSFSLPNLKSKLSGADNYSFIGRGYYPDGTPTKKLHRFSYLDAKNEIILYTREDITNETPYLTVRGSSSVHNVSLEDLLYVESAGKKAILVTAYERLEVRESISSIQTRLSGRDFMRCHRCYIVQCKHIHKVAGNTVSMLNGDTISVSRRNLDALVSKL